MQITILKRIKIDQMRALEMIWCTIEQNCVKKKEGIIKSMIRRKVPWRFKTTY